MGIRLRRPGIPWLIVLILSCRWLVAQAVTGSIVGRAIDASGGTVAGSRVVATEVNTGVSRETRTISDGSYLIPYLPPGTYQVDVEAQGFKAWREPSVEVGVNTTVRVEAKLEVGTMSDRVDVRAEASPLQTDRADREQSFNYRSMTELPLVTQNIYDLVALLPGVTPTSSVSTTLQNPMNGRTFQANGMSGAANNQQIDGVDNNEPLIGVTITVPPPESVSEVNFTTGGYSADLGRAGGAVVNVISRGGTNQFHGSAYEFHQDDHLEARNFFNVTPQPKPKYLSNKYGGTLGGPVRRNSTFFFVSYQGFLQRQATNQTVSVPVAAWRGGDFSNVPGLTIYDPYTGVAAGTGRTPFPNNQIPASRFNSVAAAILPYIRTPNLPGLSSNLIDNVPARVTGNQGGVRIDQKLGDSTQIYGKYNVAPYNVQNESILGPVVGSGPESQVLTQTAVVNVTHVFSPTLVAETRFGYNRYRTNVTSFDTEDLNAKFGIADPSPTSLSTSGLANISIGGMQAMGLSVIYPVINTDNIFNPSSSWTKIAGRHTIKFGVDLRRLRLDRLQATGLNLGPRGSFDFSSGGTSLKGGPSIGPYGTLGNSFAAFLLGATDETSRTYLLQTPTNRQWDLFGYVNDTWQVSSRLTFDIGLRWELYTPIVPAHPGGASNYDPTTNSLLIAGIGGVGMSTGVRTDWSNWAPRFGFAYRATDNLVVRGGYGISYYEVTNGYTGGTLSTQFPVVGNIQVGAANTYVLSGSFNSLPAVPYIPIPANGIISPAPDQGYYAVPFNNRNPYVQSFNLTVQRRLAGGFVADVGYVGTLGRRLNNDWELNEALPGGGAAGRYLTELYGRTSSTTVRAYSSSNNFNSLQANLSRRMANGVFLLADYTWSKSMNWGATEGFHQRYGPSTYDRTQAFKLAHLLELPFGQGKRWLTGGVPAKLAGGWQVNGILTLLSGLPVSISADATSCNCPGNSQNADAIGPVQYLRGVGPGQLWFNPSAFAAPAANRFGTAGIGTVRAPGLEEYDLSLFRRFRLAERWTIEGRVEAFNVFNTPQFGAPTSSVNSATFGQILSTLNGAGQRQLQIAARVTF
jgi:outer membrane receptor protein involved in Fe transport